MIQDAISGYVSVLQSEKEEVPVETDEVLVTKISVPFATVFAS